MNTYLLLLFFLRLLSFHHLSSKMVKKYANFTDHQPITYNYSTGTFSVHFIGSLRSLQSFGDCVKHVNSMTLKPQQAKGGVALD